MFQILLQMISSLMEFFQDKAPSFAWHKHRAKNSVIYTGKYVVFSSSFYKIHLYRGKIIEWKGLPTEVYIYNPPKGIKKHPKGHCFQLIDWRTGLFKLHWEKPAESFAVAKQYVERILEETFDMM